MSHILFDVHDAVAVLTLNRPEKLNALTPEMAATLVARVEECNARDDIRVLILTGAGEKAFCAGSDIAELDTYDTPWAFRNRSEYCDTLRALRKPAIAAINGYALGGGLETAMACDIRIAAAHARLGAPEVKLGWIGGGGMAHGLVHASGASHASLMLMTGDPIDAEQALRWGLVSAVVPATELLGHAQEIAARIAQRPPIAVQTAKANVRAAFAMPQDMAIRYERDLQAVCFATQDAREGRAAFAERRPAQFHGR